jgi:hypothetical protein
VARRLCKWVVVVVVDLAGKKRQERMYTTQSKINKQYKKHTQKKMKKKKIKKASTQDKQTKKNKT